MSLPKFNEDIQIISKLADEPNDVGGLSANEFKAKFDEAGNLIKAFINDTLLPYLESVSGAGDIGIANIPGLNDAATVQTALQELKTQLNNTSTGSIPDRSLPGEKLVTGAVGTNELANASVTFDKIANGAVNDSKIAAEKLSGASIQAKAIQNSHLNGKVIKAENVEDNSLTGDQIKDLSIPTVKIANGAVQTAKIASGAVTREKLAKDALAGRVKTISSSSYSISADDIDTTLFINSNSAIVTLSQTVASAFPIGTTIAIFPFDNGTGNGIVIEATGMRFYIRGGTSGGVGGIGKTARFKIADTYTMIALQKLVTNAQYGDVWTIQGDVEVLS